MIQTLLRWVWAGPSSGRPGSGAPASPWAVVPALVLAPAGAGAQGTLLHAHRIFGRHKDTGPAGPEDAADSPEADEGGVDLPGWASPALGGRDGEREEDAGAEALPPSFSTDSEATEPVVPAPAPGRGWREREHPTWSEGADEPGDEVAGATDTALEQPPVTGGPEDADPAEGADESLEREGLADEGEVLAGEGEVPDLPEPLEVPLATFGVPENPTLLLRPELAVAAESAAAPAPDRSEPVAPQNPPETAERSAPPSEVQSVVDLTPAAPRADPRAFPLPEGEVVFRNLRTAFTDPSRLLRHLASDGHTGVLEIVSGTDRSSYVVLLDGGVVAVALEAAGVVRTTNRVGFPAFPDGQDTLNVFRYPPAVARGLGLLLHAPVHFSGLGAVFVDLDGLNTYLHGRQADGGMVVADGDRLGVALFAAGELVGAYTSDDRTLGDLERIRPLAAKSDAEIDVRMGGPAEPPAIPLDELLRGLGT